MGGAVSAPGGHGASSKWTSSTFSGKSMLQPGADDGTQPTSPLAASEGGAGAERNAQHVGSPPAEPRSSPRIAEKAKKLHEFVEHSSNTEVAAYAREIVSGQITSDAEGLLSESLIQLKRVLQVNTLARELSLRHDSRSQFTFLIRTVCDLVGAQRAVLYMVDKEQRLLRVQIVRQAGLRATDSNASLTIPIDKGIAGWVVRNGVSVSVPDAYKDGRFCPLLDEKTRYRTKQLLTIPVGFWPMLRGSTNSPGEPRSSADVQNPGTMAGQGGPSLARSIAEEGDKDESHTPRATVDRSPRSADSRRCQRALPTPLPSAGMGAQAHMEVEAVIQVMNKLDGTPFSQEETVLLETVATIVSGFVAHTKMRDKERKERLRKEAMLDVAVSLGSQLDVHSLIDMIICKLQETFHTERCSVFFVNHNDKVLWTVDKSFSQEWGAAHNDEIITLPMDKGIVGYVARTGEMVNVEDAYLDKRFNKDVDTATKFRTRSVLCGAIKNSRGQVVAVVQLINKRSETFADANDQEDDVETQGRGGPNSSMKMKGTPMMTASLRDPSKGSVAYDGGSNRDLSFDEDDERLLWGMFSMLGVTISNMDLFSQAFIVQNRLKCVLDNVSEVVITVDRNGMLMGSNRGSRAINALFGAETPVSAERMRTEAVMDWLPDQNMGDELRSVLAKSNNCSPDKMADIGVVRSDYLVSNTAHIVNYTIKPLVGVGTSFDDLVRLQCKSGGVQLGEVRSASLRSSSGLSSEFPFDISSSEVSGVQTERAWQGGRTPFASAPGLNNSLAAIGSASSSSSTSAPSRPQGPASRLGINRDESIFALNIADNVESNAHVFLEDDEKRLLGAVLCIDDKTPEQKLKQTLNKYLAPDIVHHLLTQDGKLQLGGTKQKVSILFSDIRGFTTFSEEVGPSEVFQTLNEYFSCMVEVITKHGGIVDKFIGDALMAVFGVPNATPQDSTNACKAAVAMEYELARFNEGRAATGKPAIKIGVGVSTGEVYSGNIGSENRFEYTVIGDAVNVASRLESSTKEYGLSNLVSDSTYRDLVDCGAPVVVLDQMEASDFTEECTEAAEPRLFLREVDVVRVAGKDDVTRLFEVLGFAKRLSDVASPEKISALREYKDGLRVYRAKDIHGAFKIFERAADLGDAPSVLFEDRCCHLLENGGFSHPDWDGVWDMEKVSVWSYKTHQRQGAETKMDSGRSTGGPAGTTAAKLATAESDASQTPANHGDAVTDSFRQSRQRRRGRDLPIIRGPSDGNGR